MSDLEFYGALLAIVVGTVIIAAAGARWAPRTPERDDEPTEHGDGEL